MQARLGLEMDQHVRAPQPLADRIRQLVCGRLRGADVLIHLEPEANVHPGTELRVE